MDQTLGARLRAQREQQQVPLATIAEETKIKLALLEGLERDDVSRWPGGLFRRAYVRSYAQKIGLDPEQVLRDFLVSHPDPFESSSPVEAIAQNAPDKRPRTRIGLMIAGLAARRPQRQHVHRPDVAPGSLPLEDRRADDDQATRELFGTLHAHEPDVAHAPEGPIDAAPGDVGPVAKLVRISSPDAETEPRRDIRMLERDVAAAACLCTRIACVQDDHDLGSVLEDAARVLDACGVILWIWDPDRDALFPALAHGYPAELLAKLPDVDRLADNAIAAAFCRGQREVVRGDVGATGAFVAPLLTPDGCVGVLALEFADGGEQHEVVQALTTILTAQVSMLFSASPRGVEDEHRAQQNWSLVAS
jgi:hypothetical protein